MANQGLEASKVQRYLILRAAIICGFFAGGGLAFSYWLWAVGVGGGWIIGSLNLWLMAGSLRQNLSMDSGAAKIRHLFFAGARIMVICAAAILLLKWKIEAGIGFCAGLSSIMLAAASTAVMPLTSADPERK